eukprot:1219352-Rhodomonas_salina.1
MTSGGCGGQVHSATRLAGRAGTTAPMPLCPRYAQSGTNKVCGGTRASYLLCCSYGEGWCSPSALRYPPSTAKPGAGKTAFLVRVVLALRLFSFNLAAQLEQH